MSDTGPKMFRPLAVTLVQRAQDVDRIEDMGGGIHRVCGTIQLDGAGEIVVAVNFPVTFIEKPSISDGGEMGPSSALQNGSFPTVNGIVKDWKWTVRADTGVRFYAGASFAIKVTGQPEQSVFYHYQMEGRALRNPV